METTTIHERIAILVNLFANGNCSDLERKIGVGNGNVRNWLASYQPNYLALEKLLSTFDLSAEWLMRGNGDMHNTSINIEEVIEKATTKATNSVTKEIEQASIETAVRVIKEIINKASFEATKSVIVGMKDGNCAMLIQIIEAQKKKIALYEAQDKAIIDFLEAEKAKRKPH